MSEPRDDNQDLPRDAWLREALRHAPDAEASPPPKLNETILRMGRAAVAPREERKPAAVHHAAPSLPSGTVGGGGAFASLWAWLARPPVAAGFAVVFLSTVVGVMWMGRPVEEAMPPREETVAAAPPPATTAAEAPAERRREAPGLPEAAKRAGDVATRVAAAPPPPAAAKAEPPAPPVQAAPALPPPAPLPATPPAAATDMAARELASAERREAPAARMAAAAPAPAEATAAAPAASGIETPSLSNLRFEIRRKPDTWSWQRDDGEPRPMDDAMQDWIAQADRTARPSWQHGKGSGAPVTTTLRFTRDGVVRAILRIGPAGLQLTRGGKDETVELSRGQVAALQSSLDALGP